MCIFTVCIVCFQCTFPFLEFCRISRRESKRAKVRKNSLFSLFHFHFPSFRPKGIMQITCVRFSQLPLPTPIMAFVSMELMLNLDAWMDRLLFAVTSHSLTRCVAIVRSSCCIWCAMTIVIATKISDFSVNGGFLLPHLHKQNRLDWNNWASM